MRILILGAGKMGSFFTDLLSFQHDCAVYEIDPKRMRFLYNTQRFTTLDEIEEFAPELVINAVTLKYTLSVFEQVIPRLPKECIISDISSVKTGFHEFYEQSGMRYVSTHPMFGPTFANLGDLSSENAIVIKQVNARYDAIGRLVITTCIIWFSLTVQKPNTDAKIPKYSISLCRFPLRRNTTQ